MGVVIHTGGLSPHEQDCPALGDDHVSAPEEGTDHPLGVNRADDRSVNRQVVAELLNPFVRVGVHEVGGHRRIRRIREGQPIETLAYRIRLAERLWSDIKTTNGVCTDQFAEPLGGPRRKQAIRTWVGAWPYWFGKHLGALKDVPKPRPHDVGKTDTLTAERADPVDLPARHEHAKLPTLIGSSCRDGFARAVKREEPAVAEIRRKVRQKRTVGSIESPYGVGISGSRTV